jgi:LPXTG-site transpeptidase (sortase) family protein
MKKFLIFLIGAFLFGPGVTSVFAQASPSTLYVPLIGITSVPDPLALPEGGGRVTYHYAVKNFLTEAALSDIHVVDDSCSPVTFAEGDDNNDGKLDYNETWRYVCATKLSTTTQSVATATGAANGLTATHTAYATVVVGSSDPAPLVSVVNITKVAYPLSLPVGGGPITFTYKVNNPGAVPLDNVTVVDDKCSAMSGKLGDTNGNNLLDTNEVWVYTCTTNLTQTTTNTVTVTAYANGFAATDNYTLTVKVAIPLASRTSSVPGLPDTGGNPDLKIIVWGMLSGVLAALIAMFLVMRYGISRKATRNTNDTPVMKKNILVLLLVIVVVVEVLGIGYFLVVPRRTSPVVPASVVDTLLGWRFPSAVKFPSTGSVGGPIAYSSIRDPGGIPQGLPVRLQIPVIGVDSAIEDALITPDGRMDVPAGTIDVAWFALGPHPGEVGSAVIGGHYGIQNGVPFVFYKLDTLKVGDNVYIVDDANNTLTFIVRAIKSFARTADATTVFSSTDGVAHLNLITCEGIWNQVNGNYPDRLVIFTDLVSGGGGIPGRTATVVPAASASGSTVATFNESLGIGASGASVVALQTFLEQRGLLELPSGATNGFFGALTSAALARYQTSVGLPAAGVLGPLTRGKLNAQVISAATLPNTGEGIAPSAPVAAVETGTSTPAGKSTTSSLLSFIQSAKVLYATPFDCFISLVLLISIGIMSLKIIRIRKPTASG